MTFYASVLPDFFRNSLIFWFFPIFPLVSEKNIIEGLLRKIIIAPANVSRLETVGELTLLFERNSWTGV